MNEAGFNGISCQGFVAVAQIGTIRFHNVNCVNGRWTRKKFRSYCRDAFRSKDVGDVTMILS